ncbi:MAG: FAD-binding oxidoreductase [Chloroflexi bacterium]|nr:FAD-binding oxidoreductase [Chloroflexota bacterium]
MTSAQHVVGPDGHFIADAVVRDFETGLRGQLVRPGDAEYDRARRVFNAMINKHPALIVRCVGTADVMHSVAFAREHGMPLSVRGGGHSVAGTAVCEGGIVLDMAAMKGVRVDPENRIVDAQAGLLLRELDHETQAFQLATPLGVVSVTGIAGLTLGGGIGWINGKHGLACDNVLQADVVTADGRLVRASAQENADIFWAIRGGSGNFGVVTTFSYRLHPVGPVLGGFVSYPVERSREALRFFHAFARSCPDELSLVGSLGTGPDGRALVSIAVCYCGSLEQGEQVVRPLREFGPPVADTIAPMAYRTLQRASDAGFPAGQQHYWKSGWLEDLSEGAIDVFLDFLARNPSPATTGVGLQQMHGAASRVAASATAFAHRAEQYDCLILAQWPDAQKSAENIEWTRAFSKALEPFLSGGVYVNDLGEEGLDRVRAAYGTNYERLVELKNQYDSTNLFRVNHNIGPTHQASAASEPGSNTRQYGGK